jgi:hypothetical protein
MLQKLKEVVHFREDTLERVVVDFERSVWRAVEEEFPWVEIHGCLYHWKQAIRRKIAELGLMQLYNRNVL